MRLQGSEKFLKKTTLWYDKMALAQNKPSKTGYHNENMNQVINQTEINKTKKLLKLERYKEMVIKYIYLSQEKATEGNIDHWKSEK